MSAKIGKEGLEKKGKVLYGDVYDYSQVDYKSNKVKVKIICPIHGPFYRTPIDFLINKKGCPSCRKETSIKRYPLTKSEFLLKARGIHGYKYDYSEANIVDSHTPITIICPEHGKFELKPDSHLHGVGCPSCAKSKYVSKDEFLKRAKEKHGEKFDYSKMDYVNNNTKIKIICPKHGEFWQVPITHLNSECGCIKCGRESSSNKRKTGLENFIRKSKTIYGDKYNYSKVVYENNRTKVCIICPEHGEFWQTPDSFLNKKRCCPKCSKERKPNTGKRFSQENFIIEAQKIHGNKFDYSKVEYVNMHTPVKIICPEHGEFSTAPINHLRSSGCPKCGNKRKIRQYITNEEFIEKAKKIHGKKYDYSETNYIKNNIKVRIICHEKDDNGIEHGPFMQVPCSHLIGCGCPKCGKKRIREKITSTKEDFISRAAKIHFDKYDYSKVEYINSNTKVCIICPEHGEFWQTPNKHLHKRGCPFCHSSSSEYRLFNKIKSKFSDAIYQYTEPFLKEGRGHQSLDIYIPSLKIGIEYQGQQHFRPVSVFGSDEEYAKRLNLDRKKYNLCLEHGIKVFYFAYEETLKGLEIPSNYMDTIYTDESQLIKAIKEYGN